ncbi:hypothetical protein RI129_003157 [Pyrocoelia pectoralis]|uniref:MULE transposase domain-containing protein n=1 Tax=Pyrocoelia pectoralis TaxID=417401 RepID=A0AAN7VGH6_9COLE
MGDKDLTERSVIKDLFPDVPFYICVFHTLKTFRREITCEKLHITKEERELSLNYLQKLIYSKNDGEYDLLYFQFLECVPQGVSSYFNKNWHPIKNQWTIFNMYHCNMKNNTNNRLESINQKIKDVVGTKKFNINPIC